MSGHTLARISALHSLGLPKKVVHRFQPIASLACAWHMPTTSQLLRWRRATCQLMGEALTRCAVPAVGWPSLGSRGACVIPGLARVRSTRLLSKRSHAYQYENHRVSHHDRWNWRIEKSRDLGVLTVDFWVGSSLAASFPCGEVWAFSYVSIIYGTVLSR
jgi:hypothetical protein